MAKKKPTRKKPTRKKPAAAKKKPAPAKKKPAPANKKKPAPAKKKKPAPAKKKPAPTTKRAPRQPAPRATGSRAQVFNSGLEVWLYDEANLDAIRAGANPEDPGAGGMPGGFLASTQAGLVVGYSLYQDDGVDLEVRVGAPPSQAELAVGRWLEPQRARLKLPSGRLCVESNDASRLGPEPPGEQGAVIEVPPGDYRLTLLRVDHEALDREGIAWDGPQELVVLEPGATDADAADGLLPFEHRRDTTWVGRYTLSGSTAQALAWFGDYWDTFFVNLDGAACAALGLEPGRYVRTSVPRAGLTLISAYGPSWEEARRLPPPSGVPLDEYGTAALIRAQDWNGAETLFCRRERTKARAEDAVQNLWLEATVEVLDPAAHPPLAAQSGVQPLDLRAETGLFDDGFLTMVLSEVLPGADELDELPLADALDRLDRELAGLGFTPQGDVAWRHDDGVASQSWGARLYAGRPEALAAIVAGEASFELLFLSALPDGGALVTGLIDELERRLRGKPGPALTVANLDLPPGDMWAAHRQALEGRDPLPAPADLAGCSAALVALLERGTRG